MDREKCIARAKALGAEYEMKYNNDTQATFQAIVDALKEEGITLTDPKTEELLFRSLAGFVGGHAYTGNGNAGALTGASAVISLISDVGREKLTIDRNHRWISYDNAYKSLYHDFVNAYRGLTDKHVAWTAYGKWWDYWNPESWQNFLAESKERGYFGNENSVVAITAALGAGYAIDILEHPRTFEQVKIEHGL